MAREHRFAARLKWSGVQRSPQVSNESYSRDFVVETLGKPPLPGSAPAVFLGDQGRYNPEELLVISLSACHMLTYLAACARAGIRVLGYEDDAAGTLALKDGRMCFIDVLLKPAVRIERIDQAGAAQELHHKAHDGCFVANSVNFPVRFEAQVSAS